MNARCLRNLWLFLLLALDKIVLLRSLFCLTLILTKWAATIITILFLFVLFLLIVVGLFSFVLFNWTIQWLGPLSRTIGPPWLLGAVFKVSLVLLCLRAPTKLAAQLALGGG